LEEGGIEAMRRESFYFKWFEAEPDATVEDLAGWKAANPSDWIKASDLKRESQRLPESVFRRLHLNQWTESEDAWIKPFEWDRCKGEPLFDPKEPSYMAVDVGIRRDSAAIIWAQWHGNAIHIGQLVLTPEDQGEQFGVADVRGAVANEAARHQQLREVAFDPWSFRESAEILMERGVPMLEFPQNNSRMAPASESIYELVRERRIVHNGDRTLRSHVLAAVVSPTDRGGWRISKRKSLERIDAAISLAMAADRAVTMRHVKPPRRGAAFL